MKSVVTSAALFCLAATTATAQDAQKPTADVPLMQEEALAAGIDRASRIRDARSVFAMLERGRNRIHVQQEIRRLKSQVQQALADGDTVRADQLTRRYMDLLRQGRSGEAGAS